MKIIADENMPYVEQLFGELGSVELVNGRELTPSMVADADILLVRSVTKVNAELLSLNNQLKFVGSATIGTDHIDQTYLEQEQIPFTNAPGCNATAVGEFAFIAMLELAHRFNNTLKGKRVGIVGAGNTGSALARCLDAYGIDYLLCDPLIENDDPRSFVTLDELIAQSDIISLHVPLTYDGIYKTEYLFNQQRLASLNPGSWLLNCCRGEVIDNRALIEFKKGREDIKVVLDVWEGEPNPMVELIPFVEFATPHIAGYSLEGKARGTFYLYQMLTELLGVKSERKLSQLLPAFKVESLVLNRELDETQLLQLCRFVYDLRDDDLHFRQAMKSEGSSTKIQVNDNITALELNNRQAFDQMRKNHRHRREFSALGLVNHSQCELNWLSNLGFSGVSL